MEVLSFFLVTRDALLQLNLSTLIASSVFPTTVAGQHTQGYKDG